MSQALKKYLPREPRYALKSGDNDSCRFAHMDSAKSFSTRFVNVSTTGLAFIIDRDNAPFVGETIKLEFSAPAEDRMAWFARVVRVEEYRPANWWKENLPESTEVKVAVSFVNMPDAHRRSLKRGIEKRFALDFHRERILQLRKRFDWISHYSWQILLYAALAIGTAYALYYLMQPSENYDAKRGAPWGQRFKF